MYYFVTKKMLAILGISFLSDNAAVFTSCKEWGINREHYLDKLQITSNKYFLSSNVMSTWF